MRHVLVLAGLFLSLAGVLSNSTFGAERHDPRYSDDPLTSNLVRIRSENPFIHFTSMRWDQEYKKIVQLTPAEQSRLFTSYAILVAKSRPLPANYRENYQSLDAGELRDLQYLIGLFSYIYSEAFFLKNAPTIYKRLVKNKSFSLHSNWIETLEPKKLKIKSKRQERSSAFAAFGTVGAGLTGATMAAFGFLIGHLDLVMGGGALFSSVLPGSAVAGISNQLSEEYKHLETLHRFIVNFSNTLALYSGLEWRELSHSNRILALLEDPTTCRALTKSEK
ncbi:MAG TPA: hypothetical protein PLH57_10460 [Oligoflexia bacterium]|nr:hypothetical protein [Oligoflexia bacterium]